MGFAATEPEETQNFPTRLPFKREPRFFVRPALDFPLSLLVGQLLPVKRRGFAMALWTFLTAAFLPVTRT